MSAPCSMPTMPNDSFTRRLKPGEPTIIESRCKICGLLISGSVMHGLPQQEAEHLRECLSSLESSVKKKSAAQ